MREPRGAITGRGCTSLAGLGFEQFKSLVERLVALVRLRIVFVDVIILALSDENIGSDRFILDLLAVRTFVFGNGEQESGTVRKFDGLLNRALTEGAFTNNIAALRALNRVGGQLSSPIGSAIDENGDWSAGEVLRGIGLNRSSHQLLIARLPIRQEQIELGKRPFLDPI